MTYHKPENDTMPLWAYTLLAIGLIIVMFYLPFVYLKEVFERRNNYT